MAELYPVRGLLEHTDADFRAALVAMADRLELDPTALAAVMSFETAGDFRTGRHGASSSATGLIGFMESTAARLGTSTAALAAMSQLEQLAYVERYYAPQAARIRSVADHYMAVFAPSGVGQGAGFALYSAPSSAYAANAALDRDGDGVISVADAARGVEGLYAAARARPAVPVEGVSSAVPTSAGVGLGALVFGTLLSWVAMRFLRGGRA